jgi:hypothetical protein
MYDLDMTMGHVYRRDVARKEQEIDARLKGLERRKEVSFDISCSCLSMARFLSASHKHATARFPKLESRIYTFHSYVSSPSALDFTNQWRL